ncbi:hypothetical protein [Marinicella sp. W31]|uniref:hypothetical protein n=1 Tax=Marinicella sp. W31 TaxID=3023713 RepID=UPI003757A065
MPKHKNRNWVARAAIMRKGGVHEQTNKARRQKEKQLLKKKLRADSFGSSFLWHCEQSIQFSQVIHYAIY